MAMAYKLIVSSLMDMQLRFGKVNKYLSNTNVFEHSGKYYSVAENHMPQEINMFTLETLGNWDVNGAWDRPFTSHPKVPVLPYTLDYKDTVLFSV
jgi:carotenoid cleavage dioxygenase